MTIKRNYKKSSLVVTTKSFILQNKCIEIQIFEPQKWANLIIRVPGKPAEKHITNEAHRAGEGISEPLSDILYNMLSDELFKHPATQIESLVLSCR